MIYAKNSSHLLHPQSFYIIRIPGQLTTVSNSHNSDLYSDLDTGPNHQWIVIKKWEHDLKFSPQCQGEEGTSKERESRKYVGLSEQQGVLQNERRDTELMTREETGRARGVGVEGHVKETLEHIMEINEEWGVRE